MSKALKHCTDENILKDLASVDKSIVDRGMTCLYFRFEEKVIGAVKKQGGKEELARNCLVETMIAVTRSVQQKVYHHKGLLEAYFIRIAVNKCIDALRKGNSGLHLNSGSSPDDAFPEGQIPDTDADNPEEALIRKESDTLKYDRYDTCLKSLSAKCQERIHRYYILRQRDTEAYIELGDASPVVSRVSRNDCKKQLIRCVNKG